MQPEGQTGTGSSATHLDTRVSTWPEPPVRLQQGSDTGDRCQSLEPKWLRMMMIMMMMMMFFAEATPQWGRRPPKGALAKPTYSKEPIPLGITLTARPSHAGEESLARGDDLIRGDVAPPVSCGAWTGIPPWQCPHTADGDPPGAARFHSGGHTSCRKRAGRQGPAGGSGGTEPSTPAQTLPACVPLPRRWDLAQVPCQAAAACCLVSASPGPHDSP